MTTEHGEPATTPSQTVGPFFALPDGLPWPDGPEVVGSETDEAFLLRGRLLDGAGEAIPDGLIEIWQADQHGRFDHPDDPRGPSASMRSRVSVLSGLSASSTASASVLTMRS